MLCEHNLVEDQVKERRRAILSPYSWDEILAHFDLTEKEMPITYNHPDDALAHWHSERILDALRAWVIKDSLDVHQFCIIVTLAAKEHVHKCTESSDDVLFVMEHGC